MEDDLDGGAADETVRFGFDGTDCEIDLSGTNARSFRTQLAPFMEHARKVGRGPARRAARTAAGRQRSGDIRAWAREHGIAVSERGRIPVSMVDQYQAAARGRRTTRRPQVAAPPRRVSITHRQRKRYGSCAYRIFARVDSLMILTCASRSSCFVLNVAATRIARKACRRFRSSSLGAL